MNVPSPMTNVYHIAGLDDQERGFNRQAHVNTQGEAYQARLRYEALQVEVESVDTEEEALQRLIQLLQDRGYTQLCTQRIFQGEEYLGNQELWVDYPDPESSKVQSVSWWVWIRQMLQRKQ
jgi:hypothetical protein